MATIKSIIFDLGKVIFDLSYEQVIAYWAEKSNKNYEEMLKHFEYNSIFEKYERGETSDTDFRNAVRECYHLNLTDQEFDDGWNNIYLDEFEGIQDLLHQLKNKYRLIALSNTNHLHKLEWEIRYAETLKYFEKIFASHEMGCRKPETTIFLMVLNYLKMQPEETIFIDDHPDNIAAAQQLGLNTILVTSFDQMKQDLFQLLEQPSN